MTTPPYKKQSGNTKKNAICSLLATGILLDLILLGCKVEGGGSLAGSASLWISKANYIPSICMASVLLIAIHIAMASAGIYLTVAKRCFPIFPFGVGLASHALILVLSMAFDVLGGIAAFLVVLQILLSAAGLGYTILLTLRAAKKKETHMEPPEKRRRAAMLALGAVSVLLSFSLFWIPYYSYVKEGTTHTLIPLGVLTSGSNNLTLLLVFSALLVGCIVSFVYYLKSLEFFSEEALFVTRIRNSITLNTVITGAYFLASVVYCSYRNWRGGHYDTTNYIPFFLSVALAVGYAVLVRGIDCPREPLPEKTAKWARLEFFVYGLLLTGLTLATVFSDIVKVKFTKPAEIDVLRINGYRILTSYEELASGYQLLAFFLLAVLTVILSLFLLSLVSLISKSRFFYKITLVEVICGAVFTLMIGLFGKYYEVVQKTNESLFYSWIRSSVNVEDILNVEYKVQSSAFYWFLAALAVIVIVLIRKPYTKGTLAEVIVSVGGAAQSDLSGSDAADHPEKADEGSAGPQESRPDKPDFDPCPAFTELDGKAGVFRRALAEANANTFDAPTLPDLVRFLVNYAADSRLHLSYTAEDMAAFLAGLGMTRLTILQGMSGTGKTSLPKIFTEAIMGSCDIVEVESSWRDKNELLGYYNEFSKAYTPKKFTQALYKAALDRERITFIVLDELNLSRIEYYFSDFLSLMEHEEDKRQIKLLNVPLYRSENGRSSPYRGLTDGHTIKIPNNIWFIGTANRDESTFEISDKVYDRAHTMNFNKRAPKVRYSHEPIPPRYISVSELIRLLEQAKQSVRFDLDSCTVVREVEELLEPYNISFGNRVADQIENFVKIYAACFAPSDTIINEALERILLSKVVSKLEYRSIENKEQLAADFHRLGLDKCSEFIMKLNED